MVSVSEQRLQVLVIDDEPALREVLSLRLEGWGYAAHTAADVPEALVWLRTAHPDVILSDIVLPGLSGLDLLRRLQEERPEVPVILMTAHGTIESAVEAMKDGAEDFLTKPIEPAALRVQLERVAAARRATQRAAAMREQLASACDEVSRFLIGESAPMRALRRQLAVVAASNASVLIVGESGTGKEMAARAIHASSGRARGPFVALNAAAIPDGLLESEVFGHERGAFTGAVAARAGCFEQADRGTLLLDELAEMPVALQPKLLRVLEDGRVRRLGGAREQAFDVRLVAATNRDLSVAVREGRLREDLMYRLNVFTFALPPLRHRAEDIPLLVHHFLQHYADKHERQLAYVREDALALLQQWHWPGNVRELRNVVERAVVLASGRWLESSHLPAWLASGTPGEREPIVLPPDATLADAERLVIAGALERAGFNKAEAARRLGVDVKTIRNKLRQWETDA
jgi:DNA-binding NtrC family response regulator